MTSLFVCSRLRHVPLLSVVLGRTPDPALVHNAVLLEHDVFVNDLNTSQSLGGHLGVCLGERHGKRHSAGSGSVEGLLLLGLTQQDIARLTFYENASAVGLLVTGLKACNVQTDDGWVQTQAFISGIEQKIDQELWSFDLWCKTSADQSCFAAQEIMSYFGTRDTDAVAEMIPMIYARATAKVNARTHNRALSPSGYGLEQVTDVSVHRPYASFFTLDEIDLKFQRFDGEQSEMVRRAVFVATDAVIVLPYDPVRDRVLLVEQFRPGPFARGDARPWQLEPIAGRVDGGEDAITTAHREAMEEAGLTLKSLHEVAHCYASPGCSTEYYNIYLGIADLPDGINGVAGLETEAEDIRSYLFEYNDLMEMVDTMQAVNAPLVLAALWLARHRKSLRAAP